MRKVSRWVDRSYFEQWRTYLLAQKSIKPPGGTFITKQNEIFEKKKAIIEQLTTCWKCNIHSLPDKAALCWTPIEERWWVCQSLCASQQKQMQVRWGLRTEHKHHDQHRTGARTVCTKRTTRYEPTRTALRGYDERKTSRGHDFYVPRMQSNGSYQKGGT